MNAADLLEKEGIEAEVVHLASIKPIDRELIAELGRQDRLRSVCRKRFRSSEDSGRRWPKYWPRLVPVPLIRIGVHDRFVNSGGIGDLFRIHGMLPEDIAQAAHDVLVHKNEKVA